MAPKSIKKDNGKEPAKVDAPKLPGVAPILFKKQISFQAKRIFIGYEEGDNPELEPTYANHFEVFGIGTDVFLDIGILKPEDLLAAGTSSKVPEGGTIEIPFYVLHRIAMGVDAFERLQLKVAEAMKGLKELRDKPVSPANQG